MLAISIVLTTIATTMLAVRAIVPTSVAQLERIGRAHLVLAAGYVAATVIIGGYDIARGILSYDSVILFAGVAYHLHGAVRADHREQALLDGTVPASS